MYDLYRDVIDAMLFNCIPLLYPQSTECFF